MKDDILINGNQDSALKGVTSSLKDVKMPKSPDNKKVNVDGRGNDINQNHNHSTKKESLGPNTKR